MSNPRITKRHALKTAAKVVDWCPGNATRYRCVLVRVEEPNGTQGVLLTWLKYNDTGGPSFLAREGQCPDVCYFAEKTGLNEADSAALLALLKHEAGVSVYMPEGYDDKGCQKRIMEAV
jgi:hypothetical protein